MPPLQALVALHGLWLLILIPVGIWAARTWKPRRLRLAGWVLIVAGLVGLTVLVGHDLFTWLRYASSDQNAYIGQRVAFVIATSTDFPVVQLVLTGILCLVVGRHRTAVACADLVGFGPSEIRDG